MSVRRLLAGVATTSILATALAVAAPAQADPAFVPDADDIVGVGSDTTMFAVSYLADGHAGVAGYNAANPAQRLVSFDARTFDAAGNQTNSANVTLRAGSAAIIRPNGSGGGKSLLYGQANNADVSFARSSSGNNANETAANLQAFPFAKDTLAVATAPTSNAPATLTPAQIVGIYEGSITNWSQVGGASGVIKPLTPQTSSGTGDFFKKELDKIKGSTLTYGPSVTFVQEHDDAPVKSDPNAIAPFSVGRAGLLGTLRVEGGWQVDRALYNVVRQGDAGSAWAQGLFGPSGFVCSPAATSLILDAGFEQLLSSAQGGKCGVATTTATAASDLLTAKVNTTTTVSGVSTTAGAATLTATIGGGGTLKPQGVVAFAVDGAAKGNGVVTGGRATLNVTGLTPGVHKVKATFTPTGAAFNGSTSVDVDVTVKAADTATPPPAPTKASTKITSTFKKSYKAGQKITGKVKVSSSGSGKAAGKVTIKLGKKVVGKGKVKKGVATITIKKGLKKGKNKLVVQYAGNSSFAASKTKLTITIR
ncbi:Ig-like domain repeat protein [Nocardioides hwasunensis]|uniref:Ig-like domain repeat protein n=1 Tax=Nocardioides hwasunensis TaxID=397258 RepID=A0ABR8MLC4_9ACTN|nr:Ig-like domain repeat protein [Nocardioides hwasunensis]MBD3916827.1 Ig-like domain repeat protein [Nocardioides hwasunensis]